MGASGRMHAPSSIGSCNILTRARLLRFADVPVPVLSFGLTRAQVAYLQLVRALCESGGADLLRRVDECALLPGPPKGKWGETIGLRTCSLALVGRLHFLRSTLLIAP